MKQNKTAQRKQDISKLIAKGLTNKEIGEILHLSEHTIKSYLSELILDLNIRNRTHLAYTVGFKDGLAHNNNL